MYCPQRTQPRITGRAFRISFHLDWHFDNGIFNRPIVVPTQILVHRWGPEQGLQHCFAELSFICGTGYFSVLRDWTSGQSLPLEKFFEYPPPPPNSPEGYNFMLQLGKLTCGLMNFLTFSCCLANIWKVNCQIVIKDATIIIRFWETAHLPLP